MPDKPKRYGASPDDWLHFDVLLGLTADLLPVVSDPTVKVHPKSSLQGVGKTPSKIDREGFAWGFGAWTEHRASSADVQQWARDHRYGISVQCRLVRAIDADITDPALAARVRAALPDLPCRSRGNSTKFLLAFAMPGEFSKRRIITAHGAIEFLATGQQFVAVGQHTSGVRYEWEGGLPDAFPVLEPEAFEAIWALLEAEFAVGPSATSKASTRLQVLEAALTDDPVAQLLIDRGMVRSTSRDGKLHITCPFEDEHTSDSGDSATSYFPAHTGGYAQGHFDCKHAHCEHRTDDEFKSALGLGDTLDEFDALESPVEGAAAAVEPTPKSPHKFKLQTAGEFCDRPAPVWLVKGLLPKAEFGIIYGEPGSGKSFLVLDMGAAIAQGCAWQGRKTKRGRVVFIAAEAAGGFAQRVRAYCQQHNLDPDALDIAVIDAAPNLLDKATALELAKSIKGQGGADLIVIDTLAQTTPGANENAGEDMGRVLHHCKGLHVATGALVLAVHHAGKDSSKGARGWSGLRGAADVEIEVTRSGDERVMTITKQKDGVDGQEIGFRLTPITIGEDEDGEAVTSCFVEYHTPTPKAERKREPSGAVQKVMLRLFHDLAGVDGTVESNVLIEAGVGALPEPEKDRRDTRRQHVTRALESLSGCNLLKLTEGYWRAVE